MILHWSIIIEISILLILLLLLGVSNIYLMLRFKRTWLTLGFHFISFSISGFLFCRIIQAAMIGLTIEKYYVTIGNVFLITSLVEVILYLMIYFFRRKKDAKKRLIPPNISSLLSTINDCIMIYDCMGNIYYINNEAECRELCNLNNNTTNAIKTLLLSYAAQELHNEIEDVLKDMRRSISFELDISQLKKNYLVKIAPITTGSNHVIGLIVILHDINYEKSLVQELDSKNKSLELLRQQLVSDVEIAYVLETEKERLILLEKIQTNLMQKIEVITKDIQLTQNKKHNSIDEYKNEVSVISEQLRDIYTTIRKTIRTIYHKEGEDNDNSINCR